MFTFVKFWMNFPRSHFEIFEISLVSLAGNFKNFKSDLGKLIPNFPQNHEITLVQISSLKSLISMYNIGQNGMTLYLTVLSASFRVWL